jgi:molybdenum cofactor synthesis domain-containing protein
MGERESKEQWVRAAVITVSTRGAAGQRADRSGPALRSLIDATIGKTVYYSVVSDDEQAIRKELIKVSDDIGADVAFTLGGTGLAPSDVTPEATESVIHRVVPGLAETIRAKSLEKTNRAMLSRAVSGVRNRTLIINMPGSEAAVRESFEIVRPVLAHAVELLQEQVVDCGRPVEESGNAH